MLVSISQPFCSNKKTSYNTFIFEKGKTLFNVEHPTTFYYQFRYLPLSVSFTFILSPSGLASLGVPVPNA